MRASAIKTQLGREGDKGRGSPPRSEEWDLKTLLSLLEYMEGRRTTVFPSRYGEAPYPMVVEPDPYRSTIICALLEKIKTPQTGKQSEEKGE